MTAAPFFSRPATRALVIGSFFALTLPLCAYLTLLSGGQTQKIIGMPVPMQIYFVGLGVTHFVLTFTVYLSAENRRHFTSTARNALVFWVLPLAPFAFLAAWWGFALDARFVLATTAVAIVIRALDFQHVSRQGFGVLQLIKGSARARLPRWSTRTENGHFLGLAALLLWTFVHEQTLDIGSWVSWLLIAWTVTCFMATLTAYAIAFRAGADRRELGAALFYLCVQTAALSLAIFHFAFYACALAIHYVEYHLVMGRRALRVPAQPGDNVLHALQRSPALLYVGLLLMSMAWFGIGRMQGTFVDASITKRTLVHIFDGLFVFHYVVEMSIWKFSDPYFRKSIGPLYG